MSLNIEHISSRNRMLTFDDGISIHLILGKRFAFLCDTHLGPESMDYVKEYLKNEQKRLELVIFNSHSDWDHIWGNCAFPDSIVIGHTTCRKRIWERGQFDLNRLTSLTRGKVILRMPDLTFESRICFEDEEVEFFYAPGHTIDSSVCFDRKEKVLYIGDLVEDPIPYLDYEKLDIYLETLEMLYEFPSKLTISAHSGIIARDLIRSNIIYIRSVMDFMPLNTEIPGSYLSVHLININTLLMFNYEKVVRGILKDRFDFASFWSIVPDLESVKPVELQVIMDNYLSSFNQQNKNL